MHRIAVGIPSLVNNHGLDLLCQQVLRQEEVEAHLFLVVNSFHVFNVGQKWERLGVDVTYHPENLGVAASWNQVIKKAHTSGLFYEGVILLNDDVTLHDPYVLKGLVEAPGFVRVEGCDYGAFKLPWSVWDSVGPFDEGFSVAYCEDADYSYRMKLQGAERTALSLPISHEVSASKKRSAWARALAIRAHLFNRERYRQKWGGVRDRETYSLPWNGGIEGPSTLSQILSKDIPVGG